MTGSSDLRAASYLVTGFPKLLARRAALAFVARTPTSGEKPSVTLLCRQRHLADARAFADALPPNERERLHIIDGDVSNLHLGLSTAEYRTLTENITDIFHAAEWSDLTAERSVLAKVNLEGTRAMLELAEDCRHLRRFTHLSTVFVAGDRTGVVAEDELAAGQRFRNGYEESRFEAELLVRRAMTELPCTILRPSIVVGDSRTGEIDRFGGPYTIGIMLTSGPVSMPLPLPHDGVAPLNVVPVDFVVAAANHLHHDPRAVGRTFHLVDPNPGSVRRVYELVAQRMGRKLPRLSLGYRLTDALLKLPGLERLTRDQRMAIATVNHLVFFSSRNTLELLDGTGIRCPPIESYLDALMEFVKAEYRRKREG
jgi:thioester reductase-like protein